MQIMSIMSVLNFAPMVLLLQIIQNNVFLSAPMILLTPSQIILLGFVWMFAFLDHLACLLNLTVLKNVGGLSLQIQPLVFVLNYVLLDILL